MAGLAPLVADLDLPDLMKEDECARALQVRPKTLANQRSRREGPPYIRLSGGAIRYSRRAVTAWLEKQTVVPGDVA